MKIQYFLKDKKAMIYKQKEIAMQGRLPVEWFIPIAPSDLWCYSSQLSQNRIYEAKGVGVDETRMFVFNHLQNVAVDDTILYRDKWYTITRVDTADDYNTDTFVYVKDLEVGREPSPGTVMDYETGKNFL